MVVAAVLTPSTLRKSRRLTPFVAVAATLSGDFRSSVMRSVVTRAAIVSRAERRIRLPNVTVDAPSHVERRCLIDLLHVLNLTVTRLAGDPGVDVAHVREVNVFRQ